MKPHITNLKHRQFCNLIESTIQKAEKIPGEEKMQVEEKITELVNSKEALEVIYADYQFKLKELSNLLDEYERVQHASRIRLRKIQLWFKFSYLRLVRPVFKE